MNAKKVKAVFVTSPRGQRVQVASYDPVSLEIRFHIGESQYFKEADALGFDESLRPTVEKMRVITFKLWDGDVLRVSARDFLDLAWRYPPKDDPEYKASARVFIPKLVVTRSILVDLKHKFDEQETEERLRRASS